MIDHLQRKIEQYLREFNELERDLELLAASHGVSVEYLRDNPLSFDDFTRQRLGSILYSQADYLELAAVANERLTFLNGDLPDIAKEWKAKYTETI